jgi:hypothetical protein
LEFFMKFAFPHVRLALWLATLLLICCNVSLGQSTDARFPTPISANEISDSIAARDIGDSRLTDYFYTFNGLPGDLLVSLESKNLNGDLDVFTAGELRPLLKITFYADGTTTTSKNIYLRKRESLILRIEARTPNDDPGTYRIRFTGSFEPMDRGPLVAGTEEPADAKKDSSRVGERKTTKVSSVGARLEEPAEEVAAAPTPKPTPEATPSPTSERPVTKAPKPPPTARTTRNRTPAAVPVKPEATKPPASTTRSRTPPRKKPTPEKPAEETASKPAETEKPAEVSSNTAEESEKKTAVAKKPEPYRRPATRARPSRAPVTKPAPEPENKGRLVIEVKDGSRREYLMSDVRKVTVENGEIVVIGTDGVSHRISMSQVARMSIGP